MKQHIKTDLKILVKEADKTKLTKVNVPANVGENTTEAQALDLAGILQPLFPKDAAFSSVLMTGQTSYIQTPPQE